jgi:hypothetical protein
MPVSERAKRIRAFADQQWLKKQEVEEQKRLQQRTMFPSTLPGDRGACSPLGGQAVSEKGEGR